MINICIEIRPCIDPLLRREILRRGVAPTLHAAREGPTILVPVTAGVLCPPTRYITCYQIHPSRTLSRGKMGVHRAFLPYHGQGGTHRIWYVYAKLTVLGCAGIVSMVVEKVPKDRTEC